MQAKAGIWSWLSYMCRARMAAADAGFCWDADSKQSGGEAERKRNNVYRCNDLEAKAGIWPWLACEFHIRSTAASGFRVLTQPDARIWS